MSRGLSNEYGPNPLPEGEGILRHPPLGERQWVRAYAVRKRNIEVAQVTMKMATPASIARSGRMTFHS